MTERQLKILVIEKADMIAKSLHKGNDCEIRKSANGISVSEFRRKVIAK